MIYFIFFYYFYLCISYSLTLSLFNIITTFIISFKIIVFVFPLLTFSAEGFEKYCNDVAMTTTWGGQLELKALTHSLHVPITVYTADPKSPNIEMGSEYNSVPSLRLSYPYLMMNMSKELRKEKRYN